MELHQLQCFIATAEFLSFRKAAAQLRLTQPSVSRQVRELESELGAVLLLRDRQRVQLTDQGRAVLAKAKSLMQEVAALQSVARQAEAPYLRIGVIGALAKAIQPLVTAYGKQFPQVKVHYEELLPAWQGASLREGKIDIGIFYPPIDYRRLEHEHLFDQPFRVILPRSSPLAKKKVRLRDLVGEVIFLIVGGRFSNRIVLQRAEDLGLKLKTAPVSAGPHEAGSALVASGQGIFILPGSPVTARYPSFGRDIAVVPLNEPIARQVYIAWRKGKNPTHLPDFIATARKILASQSGEKLLP